MKLPTLKRVNKEPKLTHNPIFASDIRQSINTGPVVSKNIFKKNNQTFSTTHPYLEDKKQQRKKLRILQSIRLNVKKKRVYFAALIIFVFLLVAIVFGVTNSHTLKNSIFANPQADPRKTEIVEKTLSENKIQFEALEYKENHFEFNLKDGVRVLMSGNKIDEDVSTLQLIVERFKIEGRRLTLIDLRFDKPVIR